MPQKLLRNLSVISVGSVYTEELTSTPCHKAEVGRLLHFFRSSS